MAQTKPGFNIASFKAQTEGTKYFAKTSKFLARFPLPLGLVNRPDLKETARTLELWCEAATISGVALGSYDAMRYTFGAREKRPFVPIFQDASFSFLCDGRFNNLFLIQSWIRLISNYNNSQSIISETNPPSLPYELAYRYEYVTDIEVVAFLEDGTETYHMFLRDAFPIMLADIRTFWADNNIIRVPTVFTYTDWYLQPPPAITQSIPTPTIP